MVSINSSDNLSAKTHLLKIPDVIVKGIIRFPKTLISSGRSTQVDRRHAEHGNKTKPKEGDKHSLTYSQLFLTLIQVLLRSKLLPLLL